MNKFYALLIVFSLALLGGTGCSSENKTTDDGIKHVEISELSGNYFVLESVNGQPFPTEEGRPVELEFGSGSRIYGQVCNRFTGDAELSQGILKAENMASTMMMCVQPELNDLERNFNILLQDGAAITLEDGMLTLGGKDLVLVYTRVDKDS